MFASCTKFIATCFYSIYGTLKCMNPHTLSLKSTVLFTLNAPINTVRASGCLYEELFNMTCHQKHSQCDEMDRDTESLGGEREEGGEGFSEALIDGWMPCWSQRAISDRAKLINITASFWIKFLNVLSAHCTGTAAGGSRFIQRKTCISDFKGNISPGWRETDGGNQKACLCKRKRVSERETH